MIWLVVLADGSLDVHESQLMRRLAGLLFVDDVESGIAAGRARQRLGLAGSLFLRYIMGHAMPALRQHHGHWWRLPDEGERNANDLYRQ